jgi:hypothetical protein
VKTGRREHHGSLIEIAARDGKHELRIDGKQHRFGRLPTGKYFLHDYAYDWHDDLMEVAARYVEHRERVARKGGA